MNFLYNKKVDKVKFLGIIIDDKLNWEPHVDHLAQKLKSSIIMIKRIIKFIPNSEYNKIYDALFKSHLSYCISSWGAIPNYKLQSIFVIQKNVFAYYLLLSTHMTMLDIMLHVHEFVPINNTHPQETSA